MWLRCLTTLCVLGALGLIGCGSVRETSPDATGRDAAQADDATPVTDTTPADASPGRCDSGAQFTTVLKLSIDTDVSEEQPFFWPDENTLWFSSDRGGQNRYDIYKTSRPSIRGSFGNADKVSSVTTAKNDRAPRLAADGLILFATTVVGVRQETEMATRSDIHADFGTLELLPALNDNNTSENLLAYPISTGARRGVVYFSSNRSSSAGGAPGLFRIWRSTYDATDINDPQIGTPELVNISGVPAAMNIGSSVVSADERVLYFAVSIPGPSNVGSADIYVATRATATGDFTNPIRLTGDVNNPDLLDTPGWISDDNCRLYISRQIDNTLFYDVYVAERMPR
jgi:hypothetical protein